MRRGEDISPVGPQQDSPSGVLRNVSSVVYQAGFPATYEMSRFLSRHTTEEELDKKSRALVLSTPALVDTVVNFGTAVTATVARQPEFATLARAGYSVAIFHAGKYIDSFLELKDNGNSNNDHPVGTF